MFDDEVLDNAVEVPEDWQSWSSAEQKSDDTAPETLILPAYTSTSQPDISFKVAVTQAHDSLSFTVCFVSSLFASSCLFGCVLHVMSCGHCDVQIHGIGFQLWPAAVVFCRWLESQSAYPRDFLAGRTVLELGAGTSRK